MTKLLRRSVIPDQGIVVDLFAGGGGATTGIEAAGWPVHAAINHSEIACAVHAANHPHVEHYRTDVFEIDPRRVVGRRRMGLLWLSPDCTDHSNAKGGRPRLKGTRSLAWVGVEWARAVRPPVIMLENVPEFEGWGPLGPDGKRDPLHKGETFQQFVGSLEILGYRVEWRVLSACDFGAPTSRKRLFLIARCDGRPIVWPEPTHGDGLAPYRSAAEIIDWSIPNPSIFLTKEEAKKYGCKRPLAGNTHRRIAAGLAKFVLNNPDPFIVPQGYAPILIQTGYGERKGQAPRVLDIHQPLGTVVATGQKHALVAAWIAAHYGGEIGTSLRRPIRTITATDHHSLCTAELGGKNHGGRASQVAAFLAAYYGSKDIGQSLNEPLRTITCVDRFGLVLVAGRPITDITLRMLVPEELKRGQYGAHAPKCDLSAAKTVKDQVMLIGNSVPPEVVERLVRANLPRETRAAA